MTITADQMRAWESDIEHWRDKWRARCAENGRLRSAAERVCAFDWSSNNDADAVAAVDELRRLLR